MNKSKQIDIRNFSPKELEILEFYAKNLKENPEELKLEMLNLSLTDRSKVMAFLYKVPALYKDINELLERQG